jgi:hypothetical protein
MTLIGIAKKRRRRWWFRSLTLSNATRRGRNDHPVVEGPATSGV